MKHNSSCNYYRRNAASTVSFH